MKILSGEPARSGVSSGEHLVCTVCRHGVPIAYMPSTCPLCDGILDLVFEERPDEPPGSPETPGLWRWQKWLPNCAAENRVTLGEGLSPFLHCPRLGEELGLASLWVKNDALLPSGSFKDRAIALATSLAKHHGKRGIVLSSSGNAGASAAAYAAHGSINIRSPAP